MPRSPLFPMNFMMFLQTMDGYRLDKVLPGMVMVLLAIDKEDVVDSELQLHLKTINVQLF